MRQKGSIASLTGIRGVAAVWVLFYHVQSFSPEFGLPFLGQISLLKIGWSGVDLFFLLSGFILFYVHEEEFRSLDWQKLRDFAVLRFFRVYPLATAVLLLILIGVIAAPGFARWYPAHHNPADLTPMAFVRTLLLATRWFAPFSGDWNQPVWSLSAEIVGYCGFPFAALLIGRYFGVVPAALLALLAIATPFWLAMALDNIAPDSFFGWALVRMAGYFLGGMALCRVYRLTPPISARLAAWLGGGALAAVLIIGFLPWVIRLPAALGFLGFAFGVLIYSLAFGVGIVDRALSSPFAMFLGRISFPLYLVHVMPLMGLRYILMMWKPGWPYDALGLFVYLLLVLGAASLLHVLIERPFQRWSHALLGRKPQSHQPVVQSSGAA